MILETNGSRYNGFSKANFLRSLQSISGSAVLMTEHSGGLFRSVRAGQEAKVYTDGGELLMTGFIFSRKMNLVGDITIEVRDYSAKLMLSTHQGSNEYFGVSTRSLISNLCGPLSVSVNGESGVSIRHAVINLDEPLSDIVQRYADRAGLIALPQASGQLSLVRIQGQTVSTILEEGSNVFNAEHSEEWSPDAVRVLSLESNDFEAYRSVSGSGIIVSQIGEGALEGIEVSNLATLRGGRLELDNIVRASISIDKRLAPGDRVRTKMPTIDIDEDRLVNTLSIVQTANEQIKFVELVPLGAYSVNA